MHHKKLYLCILKSMLKISFKKGEKNNFYMQKLIKVLQNKLFSKSVPSNSLIQFANIYKMTEIVNVKWLYLNDSKLKSIH